MNLERVFFVMLLSFHALKGNLYIEQDIGDIKRTKPSLIPELIMDASGVQIVEQGLRNREGKKLEAELNCIKEEGCGREDKC